MGSLCGPISLTADGRAKWTAIKATLEAPVVVASVQPELVNELDVPTDAGVEEPEPVVVKVEAKPETGWRVWVSWVKGLIKGVLGK